MAGRRLSKSVVDGLEAREKDFVEWCSELAGFGVRVRPSGSKTFIAQYRTGGRNSPVRKVTIGAFGKLTVDQARTEAKRILAGAELGTDVAAERAKTRAAVTMSELCDLYIAAAERGEIIGKNEQAKKPSTLATDKGRINCHIKPLLGRKLAREIRLGDIEGFMHAVARGATAVAEGKIKRGHARPTGGKGTATRTVRLLGGMFSWARAQHPPMVDSNPAHGVKKFADRKGERYLSTDELQRLGDALREAETVGLPWDIAEEHRESKRLPTNAANRRTKISPHVVGAIRLLILTGARLGEILNLEWTHVDFDRGLLLLPDSKTGAKVVMLSAPALAVVSNLARVGRFVIAGDTAGTEDEKPRSDLKRPWAAVCKRAGLDGVRLHDLRHTNASVGAGAGLGLPVIGRLLGHSSPTTTARYAHLADDPLKRAADRIGGDIARAMGDGSPEGDVVPIRRQN